MTIPYQRPELDEKDLIQARMDAAKLIRKYGMSRIMQMLTALVVENIRLTKEIQEHRAARDIEPLKTFRGVKMPVDMSRYPDNWKEISLSIRERAQGICECEGECGTHHGRCNARNYEPHPITGTKVIFTVAHLGYETGDKHNKMDVRPRNLKAMCQRCHLLFDLDDHIVNARHTRNAKKLKALIDAGQLQMGL